MIKSLHISNYALIDSLDIEFRKGLNIITGETGAGKSIILGALSLLLGGRAEQKSIRNESKKSVIEATFDVTHRNDLADTAAHHDLDWDNSECVLRREISLNGRSRAFVNDSPVNLDQLKSIALQLVDIHSQHQNLLLASPPYQMQIIDVMAGNSAQLATYRTSFRAWRDAVKAYSEKKAEILKARDDEEFMRYQLAQIDSLNLTDGEQEELERERDLLSNINDVKDAIQRINMHLADGPSPALSAIKDAINESENVAEMLEDASDLTSRLEDVRVELRDIADTFADFERSLAADPRQLEADEERLSQIYDLQRRHHVDSVRELLAIAADLRSRLKSVDNADDELRRLATEAKALKTAVSARAKEISKARRQAATSFAELLRDRAIPLGMPNLSIKIDVRETDLSANGADEIEFLFAFNKNQEPLPVGKTASGGEISRMMLAIKSIVSDKMNLPSIIFDEVDTGVSGEIAHRMGQMMSHLARCQQVIAITHLPQVAAGGVAHYKVFKEDTDTATVTRIAELTMKQREDEIARMLSGSDINEAARANARALLASSNNILSSK